MAALLLTNMEIKKNYQKNLSSKTKLIYNNLQKSGRYVINPDELIGRLCMRIIIPLYILTDSEFNTIQKKQRKKIY